MLALLLAGLTAAQPAPVEEPAGTWTASVEYVYWWLRRGHAPAILTTSSPESQGILGRPDTHVVYGDQRLQTRHQDQFIGTRFALEWRDPSGTIGAEARAFFLERDSTYFTLKQRSDRLLALSYFDAATNQEASLIVAGPDPQRGLLWGGFVGYSRIEVFGQEVSAVVPVADEDGWTIDLLAGVRLLQMRDRYHHTASNWVLPEKQVLWGLHDRYEIHNAFYGGQLGLRSEVHWERFFVQARVTGALGADAQMVRAGGERVYHSPQERTVTPYGLYIQPGNTGTFRRCHFDAVGEAAVNAGYQVFDWLRAYAGYTFLYWADPMRAASQVDRVVNQPQPTLRYAGDAFWAQGWNVGLEARW